MDSLIIPKVGFILTCFMCFAAFVLEGALYFATTHNVFWIIIGYGIGAPFAFAGILVAGREFNKSAVSEQESSSKPSAT